MGVQLFGLYIFCVRPQQPLLCMLTSAQDSWQLRVLSVNARFTFALCLPRRLCMLAAFLALLVASRSALVGILSAGAQTTTAAAAAATAACSHLWGISDEAAMTEGAYTHRKGSRRSQAGVQTTTTTAAAAAATAACSHLWGISDEAAMTEGAYTHRKGSRRSQAGVQTTTAAAAAAAATAAEVRRGPGRQRAKMGSQTSVSETEGAGQMMWGAREREFKALKSRSQSPCRHSNLAAGWRDG
jgi:hypothetical protein